MTHTLTLISSLENSCLTEALVSKVSEAFETSNMQWLYPAVACDFTLKNSTDTTVATNLAGKIIGDLPIDIVIQNSQNRRKKLFLADMDSTIIGQECIDELAAEIGGGFTIFAKEIANAVGFHEFHANELLSEDGNFTGKVAEPILGQQAKLDQLNRLANEKQISLDDTIAIGDGANDLPMLLNAGAGIAFHAKPSVAAQADIIINHGDLLAILFVQGYTKADIDKAMA